MLDGYQFKNYTAKTSGQKEYIRTILESDLTFCTGPAGTGKTHWAIGIGLQKIAQGDYGKLVVAKAVVETGPTIGYLPGNLKEKTDNYNKPIYDLLEKHCPYQQIKAMEHQGMIEMTPVSFWRGATLDNAIVVLDEAQSMTYSQLLCAITRLGENSKMVIIADMKQSDLPIKDRGALENIMSKVRGIKGIGYVKLGLDDIVRHGLVGQILRRLDV